MNIQEVQADSARENVFSSLQISISSRCCWAPFFLLPFCMHQFRFCKMNLCENNHMALTNNSEKKLSNVSVENRQKRLPIRNNKHISCFFWTQSKLLPLHIWLQLTEKKCTNNPFRFDDSNDFVYNMHNSQILNLFNNYQAGEKKKCKIIMIKFQLYIHD